MKLVYKIITCPERLEMAKKLQENLSLSDSDVIVDDREGGGNPYYVFEKAFLTSGEAGETHRLVLNEDIEISEGFKEILDQAIEAHPECAFSLFTTRLNSSYFDDFIAGLTTPYLDYTGEMWGCAVLLPSNLIQECFEWIDENYDAETVHDSAAVRDFLVHKEIKTLTTVPCLVQHIGDQSLYDPGLPVRRSDRFEKNPVADWTAAEIAEIPSLDWFAPKPRTVGVSEMDKLLAILKGVDTDDE